MAGTPLSKAKAYFMRFVLGHEPEENPSTGEAFIYPKADGQAICIKDAAGTVRELGAPPADAGDLACTDPTTNEAGNTQDALDHLFQYANDGKTAVAAAIGTTEAGAEDTFETLAGYIETDKATMVTNLTAKGLSPTGTETLEELAAMIADISASGGGQGGGTAQETTLQVGASADDGTTDGGVLYDMGGTLVVGADQWGAQNMFLRFDNVPIPKGATVNSALLQYMDNGGMTGTQCNTRISAAAADDPAAPTSYSEYTGETSTINHVDWTIPAQTSGAWYNSPELKAIIQEIVNRAGWAAGNAIVLLHKDNGSSQGAQRGMVSYDLNASNAPKLYLNYTA